MQINATGVKLGTTEYTWQQSLRFFIMGALWSVFASLPPVAWALWHNYQNYDDPIDWNLMWGLAASAVGPALLSYWQQHKALLKVPPWFDLPPEFRPEKVTTTTEIRGPHATEIIKGTGDGTVVEKRSEHETKVETKVVETVVPVAPEEKKP